MTARLIAAGGVAAALLACSAPPQAPAGHAPAPPVGASGAQPPPTRTFATDTAVGEVAGVVVIARGGTYRAGCQPELIARVAARFTVAVAAEPGAALGLAGPRFSAYSISERGTDRLLVARDRDGLDRILRARAARHERQRLLALLVKPEGHLEFVGLRAADDLRRVTLTLGKGKVDCETATIAVLNGVDEGDAERLLGCPSRSRPAGCRPALPPVPGPSSAASATPDENPFTWRKPNASPRTAPSPSPPSTSPVSDRSAPVTDQGR